MPVGGAPDDPRRTSDTRGTGTGLFRRWGETVVAHRRLVLAAVLVATALLALQLRHLRLSIREQDQLPQNHPYVQIYNRINDTFGGGEVAVIGLVVHDGDVFNRDTLGKVARITRALERMPETAHGAVWSIAAERVKHIGASGDELDIRRLMPAIPESDADLARLRREVLDDPLLVGTLVSEDGRATAIVADLPVDIVPPAVIGAIRTIADRERDAHTDVVLGGGPVILAALDHYTAQMAILFPLAVVVIGLVHYEAFRTVQAMFLPLLTALLSVISALGIMGMIGLPLDTWSTMTPVAILAVAAGHAVQILKRYYEDYADLGDNRAAVVASIAHVGPVMVTAGIIACAGFASLATFTVTSVRVFGLLMACGILSALVIEMTFIPAYRAALAAPRWREAVRERESRLLTGALRLLARAVVHHPWRVLVAAGLVLAVALPGVGLVRVDNSLRALFPASSTVRRDDAVINARFAGTSTLRVLVAGGADGALESPAVLQAMEDLQRFLQSFPEIGKTVSVADYVARMAAAMNGRSGFDAIPNNQRLVAQYLFLYSLSGPDDLSSLIDTHHREASILAYSRSDGAAFAGDLFVQLRSFVDQRFAHLPVTVGIAGGSLGAQAALNQVVVHEKVRNLVQVALIIFALSTLALRSLVAGSLVLTPLLAAVVVALGVMGWSGIWLSMSTAAVTAMGVSIGADFAIYLIFRLREELTRDALIPSMERTLLTSGKGIFFVSSAVVLGYMVLMCSGFGAWVQLGGLTALIMAVSSVTAVTILPALVMLVQPRFLCGRAGTAASLPAPGRALEEG